MNTLFDGQTSCIRRFHALTDAVIILDEVQSVPMKLWNLFVEGVSFLAEIGHSTILLCSATQPNCTLKQQSVKMLEAKGDLVQLSEEDKKVFERTRVHYDDIRKDTSYSIEEIANKIVEWKEKNSSLLCICNTKTEAVTLFSQLQVYYRDSNTAVYHLSASMCKAHRQDVLREIYKKLAAQESLICISTQVIEAGVDISFECVVRFLAGLDSVAQSAGRCNRHGEYGKICDVHLVKLEDEKLGSLEEITKGKTAVSDMIKINKNIPLLAEENIQKYYNFLFSQYARKGDDLNYVLLEQHTTLYDLLGKNNGIRDHRNDCLNQAFKTAGEVFSVLDENTVSVIVPYNDEAKNLIADLCSERSKYDYAFVKEVIEKVKPYLVSIYIGSGEAILQKNGGLYIYSVFGHMYRFLHEDFYNETGVSNENKKFIGGF